MLIFLVQAQLFTVNQIPYIYVGQVYMVIFIIVNFQVIFNKFPNKFENSIRLPLVLLLEARYALYTACFVLSIDKWVQILLPLLINVLCGTTVGLVWYNSHAISYPRLFYYLV